MSNHAPNVVILKEQAGRSISDHQLELAEGGGTTDAHVFVDSSIHSIKEKAKHVCMGTEFFVTAIFIPFGNT